jgi:Cof subfamily protein (haloacid dehalogenase superfamily)
MDFSSVKLVVADMDGTLLNSRHELAKDFHHVYEQLRKKGVHFVAASGRQYYNIISKFASLEDDIIIIAENGSYVVHQGKEILVQAMDHDIARQQLIEAKKFPNVYPILCGKKQAYIDNNSPEFVEKMSLYYERFTFVDDLLKVEDDQFLKIALCDLDGAETNSYTYFGQKQEVLQVKVSGKIWLDISHPLANKGRALNKLQHDLNITRDQTMAFGDYLNDVEMMEQAHFSFAMQNAHAEVKRVSRFSTGTNDENGVMDVLYKMLP